MSEIIINDETHTKSASFRVALTPEGSERTRVELRAHVDAETDEVTFVVPLDELDRLRG